jgi:polyisoprenyl-phosphate glycosyltransferase
MKILNIVIPCYCNEASIEALFVRLALLQTTLANKGVTLHITAVDDCSTDNTWLKLNEVKENYGNWIHVIKLVKNVGSHNAIFAGFKHGIEADVYSCLAADLQDPPELITDMITHWQQGVPLVLAHRNQNNDSFVKSNESKLFHRLLKSTVFRNAPKGGFDLIMFDKKIHDVVIQRIEKHTHIFYWIFSLGFPFVAIPYTRNEREDGTKGKWTLQKKIALFSNTITSFTNRPLRLITTLGIMLGLLLFIYGIIVFILRLTGYITIEGWTATMFVISIFGSFQLIALGILGEYVWRIFEQVNNKPSFIIEKEVK